MSKCLVIGYGSIGQRHTRLLVELEHQLAVVSRRSINFTPHYTSLPQALALWQPEYVVIANRTCEHWQAVESLVKLGYKGRVLIEKPLFDKISKFPAHNFSLAGVGYNLRFHPLVIRLKSMLQDSVRLNTASVHVGSYLPAWRPNVNYRESYSAYIGQGGGVLRDLSHELDYAMWLFGSWRRLTASGGHLSHLEIDSDDAFTLLMETERCPLVTIHLNYLDRVSRREILVNTDKHTVRVDLISNTIEVDGNREYVAVERDDTYRAEHQDMLTGAERLCSVEEAMETLRTIDAAEQAALSHTWIVRDQL